MVACLTALNCLGAVGDKYGIVNSLDQLSSGDEVIICHTHSKSALAKTFEQNPKDDNTTSIVFEGNYALENENVAVLTFYKTLTTRRLVFKRANGKEENIYCKVSFPKIT